MATTERGIAYPASTGHTRLWEHFQTLADSVETAIDASEASAATAASTWTAWTPVWTTGVTSVGTVGPRGSDGFYIVDGDRVHAEFRVELGTTGATVDAGIWVLVLPAPAYIGWSGTVWQKPVGTWACRDESAVAHYTGGLALSGSSGTGVCLTGAWSGTVPNSRVSGTVPFTWAGGDIVSGTLNYRKA